MSAPLRIRDADASDTPLLEAMLFEAFFWRPERERPALAAFRDDAEFRKWIGGFGTREGDRAVVAERQSETGAPPVGAALHRLFTEAEHSYGFVDEATPEIAIGVAAEARGEGVGRALLQALVERARDEGVGALSLSVEPDNFAHGRYEDLGFERVDTHGGAWTMKLSLVSMLVLALAALFTTGCGGPFLMVPGGELRGEVASEPVADWSFVDDRFIDLEVRPSDPYSVELNYFVREGRLYIDPAEGRRWLEYLREDPNVRVRFDGTVYPVTAVLISEPGQPSGLDDMDPDRFVYRLDSRSP